MTAEADTINTDAVCCWYWFCWKVYYHSWSCLMLSCINMWWCCHSSCWCCCCYWCYCCCCCCWYWFCCWKEHFIAMIMFGAKPCADSDATAVGTDSVGRSDVVVLFDTKPCERKVLWLSLRSMLLLSIYQYWSVFRVQSCSTVLLLILLMLILLFQICN